LFVIEYRCIAFSGSFLIQASKRNQGFGANRCEIDMVKQNSILVVLLALALSDGIDAIAAQFQERAFSPTGKSGQAIQRTLQPGGGTTDQNPFVVDEILVRFRDTTNPAARAQAHRAQQAAILRRFQHVSNLERIKLPRGLSLAQAIKSYRANPDVLYAEPNYRVEKLGVPNDPSFPVQWSLQNTGQNGGTPGVDIKAVQAWNITTGSSNVVVAVIDSGVDYTHPDLAANMWRNEADCNNNGIDDDGNGYIDDCYGIDTVNGGSNPMDDEGHGTHVAGIIGATGNNLMGVVGVAWNVKIMPCKFLDASGRGTVADAIDCLEYVRLMKSRGVNIIATNNSWGGSAYSQALRDAIELRDKLEFYSLRRLGEQTMTPIHFFLRVTTFPT
jgi:subtilisin family serine protease